MCISIYSPKSLSWIHEKHAPNSIIAYGRGKVSALDMIPQSFGNPEECVVTASRVSRAPHAGRSPTMAAEDIMGPTERQQPQSLQQRCFCLLGLPQQILYTGCLNNRDLTIVIWGKQLWFLSPVLEPGSRSRWEWGRVLVWLSSWLTDSHTLLCPHEGGDRDPKRSLVFLLLKALIPSWGLHPLTSDLI